MRAAERRTGLSNWGDPSFIPRLQRWLGCIAADRALNGDGKKQLEAFTLRHACNRLELERLIARYPLIEQIQIRAPVIITGLPRSGTTALARKLAKERELRFLPYWRAIEPFSGFEDERMREARRQRKALGKISPEIIRLHDCAPDAFVDDTELQCLAFGSYAIEWHAHLPQWRDAYLAEDQTPVYRYMKRALQALTFLTGGSRRWIIKSPQHMEQLQALSNVFPDAELIVSIRDRREAERSMDRVMKAMSAAFRCHAFPQTYWKARFDVMMARYEAAKDIFENRSEIHVSEWS